MLLTRQETRAYTLCHNYVTGTPCSVVTYETRNKGEINWHKVCVPFTHTVFFSNNFSQSRPRCVPNSKLVCVNAERFQPMSKYYYNSAISHSFISQSVFKHFHSPFQSHFSTEGDLVLRLSICGILSYPLDHPVAAYFLSSSSPHFYPSHHLLFNNVFQKAVPTPNVTNPVRLSSFYCMQDIPLILGSINTSLLTRSVQLIFSILPRHHVSKLQYQSSLKYFQQFSSCYV